MITNNLGNEKINQMGKGISWGMLLWEWIHSITDLLPSPVVTEICRLWNGF